MASMSIPALRVRKGIVVPQKAPTMPNGTLVTPKSHGGA
jgi:hypothetical protein